jgi:hypothetical protein
MLCGSLDDALRKPLFSISSDVPGMTVDRGLGHTPNHDHRLQ